MDELSFPGLKSLCPLCSTKHVSGMDYQSDWNIGNVFQKKTQQMDPFSENALKTSVDLPVLILLVYLDNRLPGANGAQTSSGV